MWTFSYSIERRNEGRGWAEEEGGEGGIGEIVKWLASVCPPGVFCSKLLVLPKSRVSTRGLSLLFQPAAVNPLE